jgi:ribose transport system permease protein
MAHSLSGTLAALAGIMLAATSGSFSAAIGSEFMLPSFLAPVLGGTLLAGGVVSALGTVIGTLLTTTIRWGLSVAGLGFETLNIALGTVLLVALSVQRLQSMRRKKKEAVP